MITERREVLKHFDITEEKYLEMLSSLDDPIYMFKDGVGFYTDCDGGACVFNPSEMFEGEVSICLLDDCNWVDMEKHYLDCASDDMHDWYTNLLEED